MSECTGAPAQLYLEQYLQHTLPEETAREFEEHYFGCSVCLAELEAVVAVQLRLGRRPRTRAGVLLQWPVRRVAAGALAATLLLGFLSWRELRQKPTAKRETAVLRPSAPAAPKAAPVEHRLQQLADLQLPVFRLSNLRGGSVHGALTEGMSAYARLDCPAAVKALTKVNALDPDGQKARFYSGVCQMHEGQMARAAQSLKAATLVKDSPEQEAAWYYLAQIALTEDDAVKARHYLTLTISSHGDFQRRASIELKRIPFLDSRP